MTQGTQTNQNRLSEIIDRLREGDPCARQELLEATCERLRLLSRKIYRDYPSVQRWEQTGDVFNNAAIRLYAALEKVELNNVDHFFHLAACHIRYELMDLSRRHCGKLGIAANHATQTPAHDDSSQQYNLLEGAEANDFDWLEFHELVGLLPEKERETFDLIYFHGLSQQETADRLNVDVRSVKRYWSNAKVILARRLQGKMPGDL